MTHSPAISSSSSAPLLAHHDRSPSPPDQHTHMHDVDIDGSDADDPDDPDLEALSYNDQPRSMSPSPPYNEKDSRYARRTPSCLHTVAHRPRFLAIAAILFFLLAFGAFAILHVLRGGEIQAGRIPEATVFLDEQYKTEEGYSQWVRGAPTESFRDNVRNDTQYITSWINAGWTNDFMSYANLLYLALLSGRAAVLPPFAPSHVGSAAGHVPFGDVFDIPRLINLTGGHPILEWRDIKRTGSAHDDALGCWSIWATASSPDDRRPRGNSIESHLALDVSYTPVPMNTKMYPQFDNDAHTRFWPLAALTFPDGRAGAHLPDHAPFPSRGSRHTALPDEHMACFDFPYYVASAYTFEFNYDFSPAWRFIGTHAHWHLHMKTLALDLVRETLGLAPNASVPPYISLHARHGDFGNYCGDAETPDACFAPFSAFAVRVEEVKAELLERKGIDVQHVIMTSDERDESWWHGVREMGWQMVNHTALRTEERYGRWYPVLIDAVVQSLGAGFVGTDRSTMSLIARRRVQDWNGGATREVRWGRAGADDHKRGFGEPSDYEFAI